jgi:hypothetical protein
LEGNAEGPSIEKQKRVHSDVLHKGIVECYIMLSAALSKVECLNDRELLAVERKLSKLDNLVLVDYVRQMLAQLIERVGRQQDSDVPLGYEDQLVELEKQVR